MTQVGRNDPCPCGSGRKYKKCCLAKDEATARAGGKKYMSPEWDFIAEHIAPPKSFRQSEDFAWFVYAGLKPDDEIALGRVVVELHRRLQDLPPTERVRTLHEIYEAKYRELRAGDDAAGKPAFTCRAGCANCCSQAVRAATEEVDYIFAYMAEHGIEIAFDRALLEKQARAARRVEARGDQAEWRRNLAPEEQACVFLDKATGNCRIYEARPLNCRNYFSIGSNKYCALTPAEIPPPERPLKQQVNYLELAQLATAYLNVTGAGNRYRNLAVAVLQKLNDG